MLKDFLVTNLFFQNRQRTNILPPCFEIFTSARSLKRATCLAGEVDFASL